VAVTTIGVVPVGVPGLPPPPPPPELPPPPHAVIAAAKQSTLAPDAIRHRKLLFEYAIKKIAMKHTQYPNNIGFGGVLIFINGTTLLAAVVVIVREVVPLPVTDGGWKLHVVSEGKPAHDADEKLIVPA